MAGVLGNIYSRKEKGRCDVEMLGYIIIYLLFSSVFNSIYLTSSLSDGIFSLSHLSSLASQPSDRLSYTAVRNP